jgi:hypothetical protein
LSRVLFGILLSLVGLLYLWLAYQAVMDNVSKGDHWVAYVGAALFIAAAIGAAMAGVNLVRAKRR